jgi:hypothetical protein
MTAPPRPSDPATLADLQTFLVNALVDTRPLEQILPDDELAQRLGVRHPEDLARLVAPGPRMPAHACVEVYRHAYVARLIECLDDDYPVCRYALGDSRWGELARDYVSTHVSSHPSLNGYGRDMVNHLCQHGEPFAADLAKLEWAIVEAIHAPVGEGLHPGALAGLAGDAFALASLVPSPSLTVVSSAYPVNAFFQAFQDDEAPNVPRAEATTTAVFRRGTAVYRFELTPPMAVLVKALAQGATLGDALSRLEASVDDETLLAVAPALSGWFSSWIGSGLFVDLGATSPAPAAKAGGTR